MVLGFCPRTRETQERDRERERDREIEREREGATHRRPEDLL